MKADAGSTPPFLIVELSRDFVIPVDVSFECVADSVCWSSPGWCVMATVSLNWLVVNCTFCVTVDPLGVTA